MERETKILWAVFAAVVVVAVLFGVGGRVRQELTLEPRATQELTTFPFTGEQMLGFSGRKHSDFRRVVFPAFGKKRVPSYEETLLRRRAEPRAYPAARRSRG